MRCRRLCGEMYRPYWDFKAHPDLYAMRSVPWYQPLKVQGLVTAGIAVIVLAAMWLVRKNINKKG